MGPNRFRLLDRPHLGMAPFPQEEQDSALEWRRLEDRIISDFWNPNWR